jgi:hypothetical protein
VSKLEDYLIPVKKLKLRRMIGLHLYICRRKFQKILNVRKGDRLLLFVGPKRGRLVAEKVAEAVHFHWMKGRGPSSEAVKRFGG